MKHSKTCPKCGCKEIYCSEKNNRIGVNGEDFIYSSKGETAIKTSMSNDNKVTVTYYDTVLVLCYSELLINLYPDYDQLFYNIEHAIWGWVGMKYKENEIKGMSILESLGTHCNLNIAKIAQNLIIRIKRNELNIDDYLKNIGYHVKLI
jgi:hypothetical protein